MPLILLDQNAPLGLRDRLPGYEIRSAYAMGWDELANGRLIAAAEEAGFDGMITSDQNITHQQRPMGRKLALIALDTNHWPTIAVHIQRVVDALGQLAPGAYISVSFPKPSLRRRIFNPGDGSSA